MDSEQFNILAPSYGMLCHFPYVLKDLFQYFDLNLKLITFTPMSSLSISPSLTSTLVYLFPTSGFSCCVYIIYLFLFCFYFFILVQGEGGSHDWFTYLESSSLISLCVCV